VSKLKLRLIPSDSQRVDRDCVRLMAEMYRKALRGEFQVVAIATVKEGNTDDGNFGTCWSVPERRSELAGAIGYLNHRFMQGIYDG
jgi:hypothetical protein